MGESSLHLIFSTILRWHYSVKNEFSKDVMLLLNPVIEATLDVFKEAKKKLLPTPTKSHYTFNLRDYARVIQVGFQELNSKALALPFFCSQKAYQPKSDCCCNLYLLRSTLFLTLLPFQLCLQCDYNGSFMW